MVALVAVNLRVDRQHVASRDWARTVSLLSGPATTSGSLVRHTFEPAPRFIQVAENLQWPVDSGRMGIEVCLCGRADARDDGDRPERPFRRLDLDRARHGLQQRIAQAAGES